MHWQRRLTALLAAGSLAGADAQLGDLVPVAGCDVSLGADPGATNSVDEGRIDEFLNVGIGDAAGGQELQTHKGAGQILQGVQTAVNVGGEELDHLQAVLQSAHDLSGGNAAGSDGDAVLDTPANDFVGEAGGSRRAHHCQIRTQHQTEVLLFQHLRHQG